LRLRLRAPFLGSGFFGFGGLLRCLFEHGRSGLADRQSAGEQIHRSGGRTVVFVPEVDVDPELAAGSREVLTGRFVVPACADFVSF